MRAYVSEEMLAETSSTTTPLDDGGSNAPGSAGWRNELIRNAIVAAIATAAHASRSRRTAVALRSNAAPSPRGIEVDDTSTPLLRRHARRGRREWSHRVARAR